MLLPNLVSDLAGGFNPSPWHFQMVSRWKFEIVSRSQGYSIQLAANSKLSRRTVWTRLIGHQGLRVRQLFRWWKKKSVAATQKHSAHVLFVCFFPLVLFCFVFFYSFAVRMSWILFFSVRLFESSCFGFWFSFFFNFPLHRSPFLMLLSDFFSFFFFFFFFFFFTYVHFLWRWRRRWRRRRWRRRRWRSGSWGDSFLRPFIHSNAADRPPSTTSSSSWSSSSSSTTIHRATTVNDRQQRAKKWRWKGGAGTRKKSEDVGEVQIERKKRNQVTRLGGFQRENTKEEKKPAA